MHSHGDPHNVNIGRVGTPWWERDINVKSFNFVLSS